MTSYTLAQLAKILRQPVVPMSPSRRITTLLTDSRSLTDADESLFFALTTPTNDGHNYVADLYHKGVRAFCVSHIPDEMSAIRDADFFVVPDVKDALQTIAREHRKSFNGLTIAITGSRGKTTVKEWLYHLLEPDSKVVRSPRSFNSQIGVALSLWEISPETEIAIVEAGISRTGEMARLQSMILPDIGIITNINAEHSEGFRSMAHKCSEKLQLMKDCRCVIYCADDPVVAECMERTTLRGASLGWSMADAGAPLYIRGLRSIGTNTTIDYRYIGAEGSVTIPFLSRADIQNAVSCLALMLYLGTPAEVIAERMATLSAVGTRLNVIEGVNDCMLIYDSYTSDLHSLPPALDFMARRRTAMRTATIILSDVMHETLTPEHLYNDVAQLLRQRRLSRIIGIGPEISACAKYFPPEATFYPDTATFLSSVSTDDFDSELILIKGAPEFHFEMIADYLEARQHETILEVNLDSVVHNFNMFRSMVRPTTGIVCMVKASGYGAGSYELAKTLQSQGAAYLAVAVLDEGVDLRKAGITMPIMVLNPKVVNYRTMFAYNLEPEIYTFDILHEIIREGEKYGITDYPVHIKLDTGMHRLGFLERDIPALVDILRRQKVIRPASVFSHLAAADDPEMDDYTRSQFELFDRCCDKLQSGFSHYILRHILNSTGITRFPEHQHDLVRLGICLYGIPTMNDGSQAGLRPVSTLSTTIIAIKEWEPGITIGYNRRGIVKRPSRIATIPVGYADGINRHLGNGAMKVLVGGKRCPTIGNICMDACMIDVTDVDCSVGDRVEIFGQQVPVSELADALQTIPYEILTSVSTRVKRVYYRE